MQEAPQKFINQLSEIEQWSSDWTQRLFALQNALRYEIVSLQDMPDKIADLRSVLFEIDKSLEILSVNCHSVTQAQNKEDNDKTRNGNSDKQINGEFDK